MKLEKVIKIADVVASKVDAVDKPQARLQRSLGDMRSTVEFMDEKLTMANYSWKYKKDMVTKASLGVKEVNALTAELQESADNVFVECKMLRSLLPKA